MALLANSKFVKESTQLASKRNQKYATSRETRSQEIGLIELFLILLVLIYNRILNQFESFNKFTEFDENFKILRALTELKLNNNLIQTCPKNFGELKSLRFVDLSHNEIEELPSEQLDTIRYTLISFFIYIFQLAPLFKSHKQQNNRLS